MDQPDEQTQQPIITPEKLKSMLNLPETATDVELIQVLAGVIANLQQKYDALLADSMALEDKVANRDIEDFGDIVTNDTADFWREQLLANREGTLAILTGMREKMKPAPAGEKQSEPLKNRLQDAPNRTLSDIAGQKPTSSERAVAIRNRAAAIRKESPKTTWSDAFERAEKEIK